jgi:Domain of unknown function (DUF4234)
MTSPNSLQPLSRAEAVRSIFTAVILSFLTCGIYGLYWQYMQFRTVNSWLGREEHSFVPYLLLTVVTCGIYGLYYEYKFAQSICEVQRARGRRVDDNLPLIALVLGLCGLAMVTWCIEQNEINRWYGASVD